MENNLPLNNLPPEKPMFWETNPKLKTLLLVLIFVFLFSGIGLVVFAQWQNQYRQKIYSDTQAALPKHQDIPSPLPNPPPQGEGTSATSSPLMGEEGGGETANWKTYRNDQYGFEFQYPKEWDEPVFLAGDYQLGQLGTLDLGCPKKPFLDGERCPLLVDIEKAGWNDGVLATAKLSSDKTVKINGVNAEVYSLKGDDNPGAHDSTFANIAGKNVTVQFFDDFDYYQSNGIFDQILQTFKFTK